MIRTDMAMAARATRPAQTTTPAGVAGLIELARLLKAAMQGAGQVPVESINAPVSLPGIDFSDHRNYWQPGLSVLMITDTAFYRNAEYHRGGDTADRLDYVRMSRVVSAVDTGVHAME